MHRIADSHQQVSRSRVLSSAVALVAAGCLAACSAIKVDAAWSASVTGDPAFSNLLVVGLSPDRNVRCAFEQALADNLRSATVKATPSCDVMAADARLSREAVEAVVKSTGADAVIATRLVALKAGAKEEKTADAQGGGSYKPVAYGFDYGTFGTYGIPVVYGDFETVPSVFSVSGAVELATNVYETNHGEKIYGMTTKAKNLESRGMALALITPRIADRLRDDGLIR